MDENYCALILSILKGYSQETAFVILEQGRSLHTHQRTKLEARDMLTLKQQGLSYREIGVIFGVKKDAVFKRIQRFKQKEVIGCYGMDS